MSMTNQPVPPPGSPDYFAGLVSRVHTAAPTLVLEPTILQSLLLCLVAGNKHLVLRAKEDDIGAVQKLAASELTTIFGYSTRRVKIRSTQKPTQLLHSLFLHPPHHPRRSTSGSFSNPNSRKSATDSTATTSPSTPYQRTSSLKDILGYADEGFIRVQSSSSPRDDLSDASAAAPIHASRRRTMPLSTQDSITSVTSGQDKRPQESSVLEIPRAVVVSGLEHAGLPAQRALLQALSERRLVVDEDDTEIGQVRNLPEDLIVVYVCPWDPREKPAIYKALLDRFAISAVVILPASVRDSLSSHPPHRSRSRSDINIHTMTSPPEPIISAAELATLHALVTSPHNVFTHPSLSIYISDLFAAARHHPELDGTLLSVRAHKDVTELVRAHRLLFGDSTGTELINSMMGLVDVQLSEEGDELEGPPDHEEGASTIRGEDRDSDRGTVLLRRMASSEEDAHRGHHGKRVIGHQHYESEIDDVTTVRVSLEWKDEGQRKGRRVGSGSQYDYPDSRALHTRGFSDSDLGDGDGNREEERRVAVMDVSEVDVAKVFPRVVSHRLRVRSGPEEELLGSAVFRAVGSSGKDPLTPENGWIRKTVKDILIAILAEV
ncbi:hypothetical protein JAAARDRAFT_37239 [Jaapia argillacea MUCL 33604]|uniref:Uncharacterized protein n=1 Tax=Jaapia argillacea MUCL 33604 TaxID=933084 RepID=A0A067PLV6_9AGAM|nr:hypothetical protein JAAARDRAFT_37239 [Jaapia argillacea MUCL 33604]